MIYRGRSGRGRVGEARVADLDLERADAELLELLDADFTEAQRKAGPWLECRPGCSDCCHGPFPITRLDVHRLRHGMNALAATEPDRATTVRRRAARAVEALADGFPGDATTGRLAQDESRLDRYFERHITLACPALDPETRTCDLHPWRPVSCRIYGPPVRFGKKTSPPCDLCFRGAPTETVERCRIEPDADGIEEAILARMGVADGEDWATLIAYALAVAPAKSP
jgi:Fe-S-cluster containining protein